MGGLTELTEADYGIDEDYGTPQAFGATPGMFPGEEEQMGGLSKIVTNIQNDLDSDYVKARAAVDERKPLLRAANEDYAKSFMEGYDPNAYQAQAWAQAGIGAAAPTLSALESLNRAVAGYSGVKLQERADFGKRVEQEKQAKVQALEKEQAVDQATKAGAPLKLIDLYKQGLISKGRLVQAMSTRFFNTPQGVADRLRLQQGLPPIVIPNFKRGEMMEKVMSEVSKEAEQDKNLHFKDADARNAWIQQETNRRIEMIDRATGGAYKQDLSADMYGQPPVQTAQQQPPPMVAPPQAAPQPQAGPVEPLPLGPVDDVEMRYMPGEDPNLHPEDPSMFVKPYTEAGVTSAIPPPTQPPPHWKIPTGEGEPVDMAALTPIQPPIQGGAPAPVVTPEPPIQVASTTDVELPPTPWAKYATAPAPKVAPYVGQPKIFNKVEQEAEIARVQQREKNAENEYMEIAKQSGGAATWYDTLRQMEKMDLNATGNFANLRNVAGKVLATMGYDDARLAKEAVDISSLKNIIMQGIQQRLAIQNGVQAKDDAIREEQSFAQITDPKMVFKALVKQAQAKELRVMEKEEFYRTWKDTHGGSFDGATGAWNRYIRETPIFTMYGGKPLYFEQFIEGFKTRNGKAMEKDGLTPQQQIEEATEAWRKVAKTRK
jgi:hypothetical protein